MQSRARQRRPIATALYYAPTTLALGRMYDTLSGEGTSATRQTAIEAAEQFSHTMADQTDLWLGGEPFSNYGPALNFGPARNRSLPPELLDFGQVGPAARPQQWRAFGSAIAAIQNVAGDAPPGPGSANMRSNTYGGLLGFDYQASPNALLGLAVLLSFAQFERELIGERVRDKIAASKRKGVWVGGPVPLGYAAFDKKVVVVPDEAGAGL